MIDSVISANMLLLLRSGFYTRNMISSRRAKVAESVRSLPVSLRNSERLESKRGRLVKISGAPSSTPDCDAILCNFPLVVPQMTTLHAMIPRSLRGLVRGYYAAEMEVAAARGHWPVISDFSSWSLSPFFHLGQDIQFP